MTNLIKLLLIPVFLLLSFNSLFAKEEIKRKILVLYNPTESVEYSEVHSKLEAILNHYGYYAEHIKDTLENAPEDISSYAGLIYWSTGVEHPSPIRLAKYIAKFKDKKNILLGDIKHLDFKDNYYLDEVNEIYEDAFGFKQGKTWAKYSSSVKQKYDKDLFGFEKKISFLTNKSFSEVVTVNDQEGFETVFEEKYNGVVSSSVFTAPWGLYGKVDKIFYYHGDENKNKWIVNPFKLVEKVYSTNYPIPETTTKNGKRIAYIHLDGDGILSTAFNQKFTIENGYDFIKKQKIKTGVSYIVVELDKNGPIFRNPLLKKNKRFKPELFNNYAKKTFALPFVEPASHTYTHPFNWRKGMVAYSIKKDAKRVSYGEGNIPAYQESDKQINLSYEIDDSLNYLQKLTPKKLNIVYWSGDCFPSARDLKYIEDNNLLAFNGGDSRFDLEFNSYSFVSPLSRYAEGVTQIYSSNSNENTYTGDWTKDFWRFKNVIKTFENTGYPKRIKPVDVYYHFYSFEKKASFNALKKVYKYLKQNDFEYVYPSEFIKIAENFHDVKIEKEGNAFYISNMKELREFRFDGKVKIKRSKDIAKKYYDKKLKATYIRIKDNIENTKIELI